MNGNFLQENFVISSCRSLLMLFLLFGLFTKTYTHTHEQTHTHTHKNAIYFWISSEFLNLLSKLFRTHDRLMLIKYWSILWEKLLDGNWIIHTKKLSSRKITHSLLEREQVCRFVRVAHRCELYTYVKYNVEIEAKKQSLIIATAPNGNHNGSMQMALFLTDLKLMSRRMQNQWTLAYIQYHHLHHHHES